MIVIVMIDEERIFWKFFGNSNLSALRHEPNVKRQAQKVEVEVEGKSSVQKLEVQEKDV